MKNAEKFRKIFKEFATEVWAFPEKDFLTWLNAEYEEPATKNNLGVDEVTALAEWTEKLTKASEEAYRRGYLDCSEKLRSFQKLHDEERELKDKLNKIDIEDAWKCGFEQGVKHEKLGRTDICPHCGEYIGEEE